MKVQAQLGGQAYGDSFGLDLSMADALALPPESVPGDDLFEFMDLEPLQHRVYPKEAHVAEKIHAISYEFEDERVNSRAKDLVVDFLEEIGSELANETDPLTMLELGRQMQLVDGPDEAIFPR